MPSMERVRFVSSGTEAAMSAIRVARAFTGRDQIIKFEGCYHGHADAFLVKAGSGAMTLGIPTSPGVPAPVAADTLLARYNDLASVDALIATHAGVDRRDHRRADRRQHRRRPAGRRLPARACASAAREHGILLIFDEVISGFRASRGRRAGESSASARPDVPRQDHRRRAAGRRLRRPRGHHEHGRAGGAGVSGGHAVGKSGGDDGRTLGAEAACADAVSGPRARGSMLAAGLAEAARDAGVPLQVNAFGSLLTPFFTSTPVRDYQSALRREHRRLRDVLPGDAEARRLSAAVTVRGVVPVGGAHRRAHQEDDRRRARRR